MLVFHLLMYLGCLYLGYRVGYQTAEQRIGLQQAQEILFAEQLEAAKKRTAEETRRQLKFENDEREKIRRRIEKEEKAQRRTSLSPAK